MLKPWVGLKRNAKTPLYPFYLRSCHDTIKDLRSKRSFTTPPSSSLSSKSRLSTEPHANADAKPSEQREN